MPNQSKVILCAVCQERPAVVRMIAHDAMCEVLDDVYVCSANDCLMEAGGQLRIGAEPIHTFPAGKERN